MEKPNRDSKFGVLEQAQSTPDHQPATDPNKTTNRENDIFVIEDQESPDQFLRRLAQSNKRKRFGSPEIEDVVTKQESMTITKAKRVLDGFVVLSNLCEKLANNIDRNTKKEIKDISVKLSRKAAKLTKIEMWDWLEQIVDNSIETWKNPSKEHAEQATQTEPFDSANKDSRDQETQCELADDLSAVPDKTPDNPEQLRTLLERNWTDKWYNHTTLAVGNPLTHKDRPDIALMLTDSELPMDTGIYKIIGDHVPELREVDMTIANPVCVNLSTRYRIEDTWSERHRSIYKLHIKSHKLEDILTAMQMLVDAASRDKCTAISIPVMTDVDPTTVRKIAEIATRGKNLKIRIHAPKSIMDNITGQTQSMAPITANNSKKGEAKERADPRKRSSAIIIRTQGKGYSQVLKSIKETITAKNDKPTVNGITETKKGDVLIMMDNEENAISLQETLVQKFTSDNVVLKTGKKRILHIRGIDAISSKDDVEQAIKSAISDTQGIIDVTNIRPSYGNCQNATIKTNEETADHLLHKGFVVIGFTRCKISERIEVERCNKCWAYDHSKENCDGPDRTHMCIKCGQPGHKIVDCRGPTYCPLCKSQEHAVTSLRCPHHSKAVQEIRKKRQNPHSNGF